jgi:riboflavin kinase/FMN adenylyltransferase
MRVVADALAASGLPRGGVVTVGNYDGVHLGQRAVLGRVLGRARELSVPALVVTFDPHPLRVLAPERAPQRLTTDAQRERELAAIGLDALLVVRFTREFSTLSAERFVREVLAERLAVREVWVGSRFAFGRGREGTLGLLERMGAGLGFRAVGVPELEQDGAPISATRIRAALARGEVDRAASLLGRPYAVEGLVARGDRRGAQLGFPTLNLLPDNELLPADGVYVSAVSFVATGEERPGVSNVGVRPTVAPSGPRTVETHLLDFDRETYGERIEVRFASRLREERRFPGLAELREQIGRDVESAREYWRDRAR